MKLKVLSLFLIFTLLSVSTASASAAITPTKDQVTTVLAGYDLQGQNNTYQLACEIGQYVSEKYKWNCDIREVSFKNHVPAYVNVLYPTANNSKGYKAVYFWLGPQKKEVQYLDYGAFRYKDLGDLRDATCRIDNVCSWQTVYSFYGNNTKQAIQPNESTTTQVLSVTNETVVRVAENNTVYPITTIENSTITNASGNQNESHNEVTNSTGVINTQGNGNVIKQIWFDLSDIKNSTVNFFVNLGQ